eukprot:gene5117-10238_t
MEDINCMIAQLDSSNVRPSRAFLAALIKALRKSHIRRSDLVVKYGWQYLQNGANENERWILYEQVFTAALDTGDFNLAESCLQALKTKFVSSSRVKILSGMMFEAKGDYMAALGVYDAILTEKPSNLFAHKRKVCIYKAQGQLKLAIEQLNEILSVFQSDTSSWLELTEIYISLCEFNCAAYCMEELVLITPASATYHIRLAEIYYSQGGMENFIKARKHYSVARNLQPEALISLRTLYGLVFTCKSLLELKRHASSTDGAVTSALLAATLETIASQNTQSKLTDKNGNESTILSMFATMRIHEDSA